MPSFLENCKSYYGTEDLYKLLQIEKGASADDGMFEMCDICLVLICQGILH